MEQSTIRTNLAMELLFNELSVISLSVDKYAANEKMKRFSETVGMAKKKGFRLIRSHLDTTQITLASDYVLHDWLINKDVSEVYRNFLYGMIVRPFIRDDDEALHKDYVEANYYFEDIKNGIAKTECVGLASAYLYDTIALSLQSNDAWNKNILNISIEKNGNSQVDCVKNIYSKICFDTASINDFVEQAGEINLQLSHIVNEDKKCAFSPHHGVKELNVLWSKLKNSPYVLEGRSTDWGGNKFIRKTYNNGVIEIVLVDSDRQYALWVKTTGRNLRETNLIANILADKYE